MCNGQLVMAQSKREFSNTHVKNTHNSPSKLSMTNGITLIQINPFHWFYYSRNYESVQKTEYKWLFHCGYLLCVNFTNIFCTFYTMYLYDSISPLFWKKKNNGFFNQTCELEALWTLETLWLFHIPPRIDRFLE